MQLVMSNPNFKRQDQRYCYKFLILLVSFYYLSFPLAGIGIHKPIEIGPFHLIASTIVFPLAFVISDIIAEVYGYKVSRQMIWCLIPATLYYQSILIFFLKYPADSSWHFQYVYDYMFQGMGIIGTLGDIGVVVGFLFNSYLLIKWKILLKSRYFWMRSIGSSAVAEFIQLLFGLFGMLIVNNFNISSILLIFVNSFLFRLTVIAILAPVATMVVCILKKTEKIDDFNFSEDFNPFRFNIDDMVRDKKQLM